ncbi:alpha/beta hydrolase [Fictibacillus barbaricus]|uniref:Alpha/beta hydrolase n=1 Tax=Fictibacillus barbaricus TaxID=182136 RepID=A0ABS2ZA47_9BACL|nr:alpha/beta hydrolase [Fictibacillus barbaricus]MBN3544112.1 alpha/beta hydrolase [Fictibacillus barbaricus]GGB69033.1 lipase/esterase [Fictibacillus barbaricus]
MLDPSAESYLQSLTGGSPLNTMSPEEARRVAKEDFTKNAGKPAAVNSVEESIIQSELGRIDLRIITPLGDAPFPVVIFYHGGGWVLGDLDDYEVLMKSLAAASNSIVVGVGYGLSPENKFPKAVEESYAALNWVHENIKDFGGDPERIALVGDSAGGNLATVSCMLSKQRGGPHITYQILIYPTTDLSLRSSSWDRLSEGYFLGKEDMIWFRDQYLSSKEDVEDPRASPLLSDDLSGLPPALVITAEYDPLKDEGEAYAQKMKSFGVDVDSVCYKGMIHTFVSKAKLFEQAQEVIDLMGNMLKRHFQTEEKE